MKSPLVQATRDAERLRMALEVLFKNTQEDASIVLWRVSKTRPPTFLCQFDYKSKDTINVLDINQIEKEILIAFPDVVITGRKAIEGHFFTLEITATKVGNKGVYVFSFFVNSGLTRNTK